MLRATCLISLLLVAACDKGDGTFVVLSFEGPPRPADISRVHLELTLAERMASADFIFPSGTSLPTRGVLDIKSGEGRLDAVATAFDASGAQLAEGRGAVDVVRSRTVTLPILFGGEAGDMTAPPDLTALPDLSKPTVPGAPGTPSAVVDGPRSANITFTAAADHGAAIDHYTVTSSPGAFTANTPDGNTLAAKITGLTVGVQYTFTVTATNSIGTGPPSNPSAVLTAIDVPVEPTGVKACPASAQVKLSYTLPVGATSANIYYQPFAGVSKLTAMKVAAAASPKVVTGLNNGTTYHFAIAAVNAAGESALSVELSALPHVQLRDMLFVSTLTGDLDVFDCVSQLPSGSSPTRSFTDANVMNPQYGAIGVDRASGIFYLGTGANSAGQGAILIWDRASLLSGAAPPDRQLYGMVNAKFQGIRGVAVDPVNKRLYVNHNPGTGEVRGWNNSNTIDGDVAPVFTITGLPSVNQLFYEPSNDHLIINSFTNGVYVFASASTLSGALTAANAFKQFSISGISSYLGVGASNNTLFLGSYMLNGTVSQIANYHLALSGSVGASATLNPNGMGNNVTDLSVGLNGSGVTGLWVLPENDGMSRVFGYDNAFTASGTAPPNKIFTVAPHANPGAVVFVP